MPDLIDKQTGERVTVPETQLQDMLASGQASNYTLAADAPVRVVDAETGEVKTTSAADLGTALQGGFKIATAAEVVEHEKQQQFGEGVGNVVRTAAESGFNNLLLGAGDAVLTGFGADPEGLRERRDRNEVASIVGGGIGLIAPLLASGGGTAATTLGRVGRGLEAGLAASPAALTARAGRAAASEIAERFGGGLLARTGAEAGVGAVEGALYGAGSAVSDVALSAEGSLGDHEAVGEYVLAKAGEGALYGALAGGGLTLGAEGLKRGTAVMSEQAKKAFAKATGAESVEAAFNSFAFAAIRSRKAFAEQAERFVQGGGANRAGAIYREEIEFAMGDTVQSLGAKMRARHEFHRARATDLVAQADEALGGAVDVRQVMQRVERDVVDKLGGVGKSGDSKRAAKAVRREIEEVLGISDIKRLERQRASILSRRAKVGDTAEGAVLAEQADDIARQIDDLSTVSLTELRQRRIAFANSARLGDTSKALRRQSLLDADRAIERQIEDGLDAAGLLPEFKDAKERIAAFGIASDAAEDTMKRDQSNRFLSLSDMLTATSVAAGDIAVRGAPDVGTLGLSMITGLAHKLVREKGSQSIVALSQRVGGLKSVARDVQQTEAAVQSATKAIVGRLSNAAKSAAVRGAALGGTREDKYEQYREKRKAIAKLSANPELLAAGMQRVTLEGAPNVAQAATMTAQRAVQFLQSKAPRERPGSLVRPDLDETRRVSDGEVNKFLRYARGVEDPLSVLRDAERGDITREGVEALRAVYPKMYAKLVDSVMEGLGDLEKPPPMSSLVQMSLLLGQPLHFSMRPGFILAHQKMYAERRQQQAQPRPPSAQQKPDTAQSLMTPSQRIEAA